MMNGLQLQELEMQLNLEPKVPKQPAKELAGFSSPGVRKIEGNDCTAMMMRKLRSRAEGTPIKRAPGGRVSPNRRA